MGVQPLHTGCSKPCVRVCVCMGSSRWSKHKSFVSPLNVVPVSLPVMTAIVAASVACVLEATLDPAVIASGVMMELEDVRRGVTRGRDQKGVRNVWLNVSNIITTYIVTIILNKLIKCLKKKQ